MSERKKIIEDYEKLLKEKEEEWFQKEKGLKEKISDLEMQIRASKY
jgi:hypothetical protein